MRLALVAATVLTAVSAHVVRADALDDLADKAGVDSTDLHGALNSQPGVDAEQYLVFDGKLAAPAPVVAWPTRRLACIARAESNNTPNATNPRSGAAGLFQFLRSTWMTTPQGKAGLSPYDPTAATHAAEWMVAQGRIREWTVVQMGIC